MGKRYCKTISSCKNPWGDVGIGSGLIAGMCAIFDPMGILIQMIAHWIGHDIRTIGGLGLFEDKGVKVPPFVKFSSKLFTKTFKYLILFFGIGVWINVFAVIFGTSYGQKLIENRPPHIIGFLHMMPWIAGVCIVISIIGNVRRKRIERS